MGKEEKLSKQKLETLLACMEEIDWAFGWLGFDSAYPDTQSSLQISNTPEVLLSRKAEPENDVEILDNIVEDWRERTFEKEDIEIAIDTCLSALIKKKVFPSKYKDKLVSLSEAFTIWFGSDDELVASTQSFEEHIQGYFDSIDHDSMVQAHEAFTEIVSGLHRLKEAA